MAWRPTRYLIGGELDNTERRRVVGWMRFMGLDDLVTFDLEGEFHRDVRGAAIRFYGDVNVDTDERGATEYMRTFANHQTGKVGDITAGLPPQDYSSYPYIEWYSDQNGRVVLELDPEQIEVVGMPIPARESYPIPRYEQKHNMAEFLSRICRELPTRPPCGNHRQKPPTAQPGDQPLDE